MCDKQSLRDRNPANYPADTYQCPYCGIWNHFTEGQIGTDCIRCGKPYSRGARRV